MTKYIKYDTTKFYKLCSGVICERCPFYTYRSEWGCRLDNFFSAIPAADVVVVCRCKYCVYCAGNVFTESDKAYCIKHDYCVSETYFCADGKRRLE